MPGSGEPSDGSKAISSLARRPRQRNRMEFALPTINVIFLLMLYFLLAGTLVQKSEMGVIPPQTSQFPKDRLPRPLLLIAADGAYSIDGLAVDETRLIETARSALAGPKALSAEINILAPAVMDAAPFLNVLAVLDAARVPVRVVTLDRNLAVAGTSK